MSFAGPEGSAVAGLPVNAAVPPGGALAAPWALLPMAVHLHPDGRISDAGRTIRKLIGDAGSFAAAFEPLRAARDGSPSPDLPDEGRLFLRLRERPAVTLRGDAMRTPGGGVVINLGFGIGLAEAVARFGLTDQDFAGAELAMEMLFLHEANGAMLAELSRSNLRLEEARRAAEVESFTDPLTGLHNRRGAEVAIGLAVQAAAGFRNMPGLPFSLIHLDLDLFKGINDTHGHAAGDDMLRVTALKLRQVTRADDSVARMGGDEFLLVMPGLVDRTALRRLGRRIVRRIEEPVVLNDVSCRVSASLGVAMSTSYDAPDAARMMGDADRALYAAKVAGRGRVAFADEAG
ncbi:GGDEF domain-containing protein [Paracoccus marinus]|uniref:GGDEF domain-containing protein n=1 Tax=Paracoccus marinus TaxID=288426 RepID=UPI00103FEA52|nr:GGDEF domain-containing protein [Paracoccus marinus]GLS80954.1 GGDEF domain-containing protein [Paracoccus marinus]